MSVQPKSPAPSSGRGATVESYEPATQPEPVNAVESTSKDAGNVSEPIDPASVPAVSEEVESMLHHMEDQIPENVKKLQTVRECINTVSTELKLLAFHQKIEQVETEYHVSATALIDAKLLNAKHEWTNPTQKLSDLSPDLRRATLRFKDAQDQKKALPVLGIDQTHGQVKNSLEKIAHMTRINSANLELEASAKVLRDAKLLDKDDRWIKSTQKMVDLSPELQNAVVRYKRALIEKKSIQPLEEDMNMSLRALHKLLRAPIDGDLKLVIVIALAPILVAVGSVSAAYNLKSACQDAVSRIPKHVVSAVVDSSGIKLGLKDLDAQPIVETPDEIKVDQSIDETVASATVADVVEVVAKSDEITSNIKETQINETKSTDQKVAEEVKEATLDEVSELLFDDEPYSACSTVRELEAALAACRANESSAEVTVSIPKGKSI